MPDSHYKFVAAAFMALGLAACGEKPAVTEQTGGAHAPAADAATQAGLSGSSQTGAILNAPGNYVRGMAGNVEKAKQAAALAGKTAEDRVNMDPLEDTGN